MSSEGVNVDFGTTFYMFSALKSIRNYGKPDILHIHWLDPFFLAKSRIKTFLRSIIFIGELLIVKIIGVKIVWTVHNITSHDINFRSIELFFTKVLTRLFNRIIVHCSSAKNEVIDVYGVKKNLIVIIPHGNYIHCYKNTISMKEARRKLHLSVDNIVFLYFGLIRPYKGIFGLINSFNKLNNNNAKLLITGKPLNDEVANNIQMICNDNEKIKINFGFVTDDEIQTYMNAIDVVVLPYENILTSGAVILAMSFGKPIIAPSIGCIPEVLDNKGSFLYDPLQEAGLLKAIKQSFNSDLKKMGEYNYKLVNKLSWDKIAKKTISAYKECLNKKGKVNIGR
jgi:glycosyltransferase involved in cell wall biosynthesis